MASINRAVAAEVNPPMDSSGIGGHPGGLTTLFFTEMWERFSYYGMRAILILYMVASPASGGLGFDTARAAAIYGSYTSAAYLTALPGGWLADRFLGARRAVLYGGILIALGHFSMALGSPSVFFAGMILIVAGTGLLKPNISTMVGDLYGENDPRRDAGFSIFYMGINLGALISPLVCGYLGQRVDWHLGFGAAGIGMTLGLVQFWVHRQRLAQAGKKPNSSRNRAALSGGSKLTADEVKRLTAIGVLFVFASIFWAAFEQAGSSLNLFADQVTDNRIMGWEFPSSWFQSVNSICLIGLAPVFSWWWLRLGDRQPSSPAKFSYGLLFVGLGFILAAAGASVVGNGKVSPAWLIGVYLLHTIGELCLSPVGLSTVTKLAPARLAGLMMGVWFLSISAGNYLGGWIAGFYDATAQGTIARLFGGVAIGTLIAAGILAALNPFIRSLMGRVR